MPGERWTPAPSISCRRAFRRRPWAERAAEADVPCVMGAFTPSEVLAAHATGVDAVKVFPVSAGGGDSYIKALRSVFPDIVLAPTGGITPETVGEFLRAGAAFVGVGGKLVDPVAVADGRRDVVEIAARTAHRVPPKPSETRSETVDPTRTHRAAFAPLPPLPSPTPSIRSPASAATSATRSSRASTTRRFAGRRVTIREGPTDEVLPPQARARRHRRVRAGQRHRHLHRQLSRRGGVGAA